MVEKGEKVDGKKKCNNETVEKGEKDITKYIAIEEREKVEKKKKTNRKVKGGKRGKELR